MNQNKINDRKQYIEQVRQSFHNANAEENGGQGDISYEDRQAEEEIPRGYFRLRLLVAFLLFLAYVFIWKTGASYGGVDAASIQEKIQANLTLPDSLSKIPDILSSLEK